jgi:hypothetical protein
MKKLFLITSLAMGLALFPTQDSDAHIYVGVPRTGGAGIGFGYPAYPYTYFNYPGYYGYYPYRYYGYYGRYPYRYYRSYYYSGNRVYRQHKQ